LLTAPEEGAWCGLERFLPSKGQGHIRFHLRPIEVAVEWKAKFNRETMARQRPRLTGQIESNQGFNCLAPMIVRVGRLDRRHDIGVLPINVARRSGLEPA
jgi:hypothetical protein